MASAEHIVIREVVPGLRIYSRPFNRFGLIPIGGRSTAIRMSNGEVLVTASTPLTPDTRKSVDELGPVRYIIALDAVHYLYLKEWKAAYTNAHVAGVTGSEKNSSVKHDGIWGRDEQPLGSDAVVNDEFQVHRFDGHHSEDLAVLHIPTKTLIQADLLFNMPATEQYSIPGGGGLIGRWGRKINVPPHSPTHQSVVWNALARDRAKMAYSASFVATWDFDRIIPCHGDVVEKGGNKAWRDSYTKYFDGIASGKFKGYTAPEAEAPPAAGAGEPVSL